MALANQVERLRGERNQLKSDLEVLKPMEPLEISNPVFPCDESPIKIKHHTRSTLIANKENLAHNPERFRRQKIIQNSAIPSADVSSTCQQQ